MQIADILAPDRVVCDVDLSSKKAVLEALSGLLAGAAFGAGEKEIFDCLLSRERLGGTGLGNGIALPHGRLKHNRSTVGAFIRLRQGVDYDAADRRPVDLLFALLAPEHAADEHLQVLSQLAERFNEAAFLERLREEESGETIYRLLTA